MGQAAEQGDELRLPPGVGLGEDGGELRARRRQLYAQSLRGALKPFAPGYDTGQPGFGGSKMKGLLQQSSGRRREIIQVRRSDASSTAIDDNLIKRTFHLPAATLAGSAITAGGSCIPLPIFAARCA